MRAIWEMMFHSPSASSHHQKMRRFDPVFSVHSYDIAKGIVHGLAFGSLVGKCLLDPRRTNVSTRMCCMVKRV